MEPQTLETIAPALIVVGLVIGAYIGMFIGWIFARPNHAEKKILREALDTYIAESSNVEGPAEQIALKLRYGRLG